MPYSNMFDPFDPEELRRRQAMAPEALQEETPVEGRDPLPSPPSSVMEEDTEDANSPDDNVTPTAAIGGPTDTQRRYRETLQAAPNREDYQPSKWRRFGAALAGGLAGMRNPEMGVKVAEGIRDARYNTAQQDWASKVNRSALEMGLDKDIASQDIARRRADAYQESAHARTMAAKATEAYRLYQQQHQPYHPSTEDEAIRLEQAKHAPAKPTPYEEYQYDPSGYRDFINAQGANKPKPLSVEDRIKIEGVRQSGANSRNAARIKAAGDRVKTERPVMASPRDQKQAEDQAIEQVLREHPEYVGSVERAGTVVGKNLFGFGGTPTKANRIKDAAEVTEGLSGAKAALAKDHHNQFLSELGRKKRAILGTQKVTPSSGSTWDIQENDEEDQ